MAPKPAPKEDPHKKRGPDKGLEVQRDLKRKSQRKRIETKSQAARERAALTVDRFLQMPGMEAKKEQLTLARKVIGKAINNIRFAKISTQKALRRYTIQLQNQDYYLALALKESSLDPKSVSRSNAVGYFQIKFDKATGKSKAVSDVNETFNFNYTQADVYYAGNNPALQEKASINNAIVGILYWHLCRDIRPQRQGLDIKEQDKDKAAAFAYKLGSTSFANLWKTLKPKDFDDFGRKLGTILADKFLPILKVPPSGVENILDPTYGIYYPSYIRALENFSRVPIKIGDYEYNPADLIATLRYTELIYSMAVKPPLPAPILEPDPLPTRKKPAPAPKPTPASAPKPAPIPPRKLAPSPKPTLPEGRRGIGYETVHPPDRFMWSIADKILRKCTTEYKIPYFLDPSRSDTLKIRFLITTTINYNKKIKKNPAFNAVNPDDQDPNIKFGSIIYFPTKDYILNAIKTAVKEVPPPPKPPEILPQKVPMYTGPDSASLEKTGREILQYSGPNPPFKLNIPSYKNKPLHPNQPSFHGIMRPADVKYIVLHSTEGIIQTDSKLYRYQLCHYLVRKDGTVELIRDEAIAIDHAGRWNNHFSGRKDRKKRASMAIWNGDKDISLHSIGIEVETNTAGTYNNQQYQTLKTLIPWIGSRYKIPKGNVVTHSMVAVSDFIKYIPRRETVTNQKRFGRGRKMDPRRLDWAKLRLPNNYRRVDPDVATGAIGSNLRVIGSNVAGKEPDGTPCKAKKGWCNNTSPAMIEGLKAAERIYRQRRKPTHP